MVKVGGFSGGNSEGKYVWKKLTAQGGDFIDFAVSDNVSDYPDGAVHTDGYWYELFDSSVLIPENIREGIDIFGVVGTMVEKKVTYKSGSYTPTSYNAYDTKIPHGMGEKPTYAGITQMHLAADYVGDYYAVFVDADATNIKLTTGLSKSTNNPIKWFAVLIK